MIKSKIESELSHEHESIECQAWDCLEKIRSARVKMNLKLNMRYYCNQCGNELIWNWTWACIWIWTILGSWVRGLKEGQFNYILFNPGQWSWSWYNEYDFCYQFHAISSQKLPQILFPTLAMKWTFRLMSCQLD